MCELLGGQAAVDSAVEIHFQTGKEKNLHPKFNQISSTCVVCFQFL